MSASLYALLCLVSSLAMSGCAEKRVQEHIDHLSDPDRQVREKAGQELVALGHRSVPPLLARARAGSDTLQYISAQILGQIGDQRAIPFLRQLGRHDNQHIRREAILALGMMETPILIDTLARVLASDPDTSVRRAATWSLGNLRDTLAVPSLIAALDDSSALVRQHILTSLNRLWTADASPRAVVAALKEDSDPTVRYIAAQILGNHLWHPETEALIAALEDGNVWVRTEAVTALGKIGGDRAIAALEELLRRRDGPDQDAARQALRDLTGRDYVIVD